MATDTGKPRSIQQRARQFPCSCGALPGEYCRTWDGRKSYNVHLHRLEQENDAWLAEHRKREGEDHG